MDFGLQLLAEMGIRAKAAEHRCKELEAQNAELRKKVEELTAKDKTVPEPENKEVN